MTTTFNLTANELKAALVLVRECLSGMGGQRPSDLDRDPYTWCNAQTLIDAGWSKEAAAGTYGSLAEKGFIDLDREGDCVSTAGYQFIDTVWDGPQMTTHHCDSTGEAYDCCQTMDDFKDGDLLIIESEQVAGVVGTWPIAVTAVHGSLHSVDPEFKGTPEEACGCSAEQLRAAKDRGWALDPVFASKEAEMTVALINLSNLKVEFHVDPEGARVKAEKRGLLYVGKPEDLGAGLTGPQMVALYNATAAELNTTPVNRFATKEAAVKRTMGNLARLWELRRKTKKSAPRRGINLAAKKKAYACREGSKQAILVDMLWRAQGATMAELLEALSGGAKPWKEVTVKSGLNWDMNKIKGYGIRTRIRFGETCYHLVLPSGMVAPVPHTPKNGN